MWLIVCLRDFFTCFTHTLDFNSAGGFITWLSAVPMRTDLVNKSNNWISRGFCTLKTDILTSQVNIDLFPQLLNQLSSVTGRIKESSKHLVYRKQLLIYCYYYSNYSTCSNVNMSPQNKLLPKTLLAVSLIISIMK